MQRVWVRSLIRELRFHMPCSQKKTQNIKQKLYFNYSIKTLKMVQIKTKILEKNYNEELDQRNLQDLGQFKHKRFAVW